jgi:cell fate regulator YaaT (PSP1 superfamily)
MTADFIELGFKGERKILCANPNEIALQVGDYAICSLSNGSDLGIVLNVGRLVSIKGVDANAPVIKNKADADAIAHLEDNRRRESEALQYCRQRVSEHQLNMKLVDVEYQFDRNKITFYFTAEKRVDFRALVKDLAGHYRTRIELRQIGVRDEARRIGGIGICGQQFCCVRFIKDFAPISTQYAKDQDLPMNPGKLSGACGRLMCCLAFERDTYLQCRRRLPGRGDRLQTARGRAVVSDVNIFKEEVTLYFEQEEEYETISRSAWVELQQA